MKHILTNEVVKLATDAANKVANQVDEFCTEDMARAALLTALPHIVKACARVLDNYIANRSSWVGDIADMVKEIVAEQATAIRVLAQEKKP